MPQKLLKLEVANLTVADVIILQRAAQQDGVYGYQFKESLGKSAIINGAIYKRFGALARHGLLDSELEQSEDAILQGRAARRIHVITDAGRALVEQVFALLESAPEQALSEELTTNN